MARETRDEKRVNSMIPALTEHMIELKTLISNETKEAHVETWAMSLLKFVLGYSHANNYAIKQQETKGKSRFDLVIVKSDAPDQVVMLIEVKNYGTDLSRTNYRSGRGQLEEYLKTLNGVRWGILTNGVEWQLYDFKNDMICLCEISLDDEEGLIDMSASGIKEVAEDLLEISSYYYASKDWEKLSLEAQALSPDSLAKGILNPNCIKLINKYLSEEYDFKASNENLLSKLSDLLVYGLNERGGEWTDSRKAEFQKFVRSQKKFFTKAKRKKRVESIKDEIETVVADTVGKMGENRTLKECGAIVTADVVNDEKKVA